MTKAVKIEEHASLTLNGEPFEVVAVDGREGMSELFRFDVTCAVPALSRRPLELLGAEASLTLRDAREHARVIVGLVAEANRRTFDDGSAVLSVTIRPAAYPLSIGRDCYALQEVDVIDVIKDVLFDHRGPVRYEITRAYNRRHYVAQYREDDWTFLSRLLEEEGLFYWFDHAAGTALVFGDSSTSAPDLDGGALIPFFVPTGMHAEDETVEDFGRATRVVSTRFVVASFDPKRPAFRLETTAGGGPYEVYDAPGGGSTRPEVCAANARVKLEAARVAGMEVRGSSTSVRLSPGRIFEIEGHPLTGLDGRYLITRARHEVRQRRRDAGGSDGGRPYLCRFEGIPARTPFRAPAAMPHGKQPGLQLGVVVGQAGMEVHPDPRGRVRVQLHWDRLGKRDHAAGKWVRVAQRSTPGSMLLPRVGWNVATVNEEGGIDAPTLLNRIHDAEHPPAYALPENKTRVVFKTATTPGGGSHNEIHFEDRKGAEHLFLNASKDMTVTVKNVKRQMIERDQTRVVGNNHDLTVDDTYGESVTVNQSVTIAGSESITAESGRSKSVGGSETVTIGGNRTLTVGGARNNAVHQDRRLEVGGSVTETTKGAVSAACKAATVSVGGSLTRTVGGGIADEASVDAKQTVGGSKIETAAMSRVQKVDAASTETISGSLTVSAGGNFVDDADTTSTWTVASTLSASGPVVWVEAKDELRVRCGGSTLVITPGSISINAPSLDLSGAHLQAVSGVIDHN